MANSDSIGSIIKELEIQEKELQAQLDKISKAKALLMDRDTPAPRRGRPAQSETRGKPGRKPGRKPGPRKGAKRGRKKGGITYLDNIREVLLSSKKPMSPNEVLKQLFDKDPSKDFKAFSKNIYPVFSRSYKNKSLIKKGGKIHLPASAKK